MGPRQGIGILLRISSPLPAAAGAVVAVDRSGSGQPSSELKRRTTRRRRHGAHASSGGGTTPAPAVS
ncbi:hypothetical protein GUJ93_ZPchr0008g12543 [Zizania palustris]|uniref:Uncharacterized protein n=1 Tax=Zizania palustris TaxID=103762 RepID=A0A8J5RLW8_ZIZPA|nr:hypothetical protein GUJ93_ZPchr0008g12543 [Zizania palustris]